MTTGLLRPSGAPPPLQPEPGLGAAVLDARAFVEVEIPRTTVRGRMRLLTRTEAKQIRSESRSALRQLGLNDAASSATPELYREWHEEIIPRTMAVAVRSTRADVALAPLEEWLECHDDQLQALWRRYVDLEAEMDPLARPLTEAEFVGIRDAAKKKDAALLMSYGSSALATYAITTESRPAS